MRRPKASESRDVAGIIAAAATPRRAHEYSIDLSATLELIDFLVEAGCDGLLLLGSTGEFVHFAMDDRMHMVRFAAKRSRVPLLVNVSHTTFDTTVELARDAADAGVAGVLVMPPYFYRYQPGDIRCFMLEFAKALQHAAPIYLYNIPSFSNPLPIEIALELLATGEFAGIKDSSGSSEYSQALRAASQEKNFRVFLGDESIYFDERQKGLTGAISGVASAVPELMSALEAEIVDGNIDRARCLNAHVQDFVQWHRRFPLPIIIKEALRQRGRHMGADAVPLASESVHDLDAFRSWFNNWFPAVLRECDSNQTVS